MARSGIQAPLTDQARMARIGELLARAVARRCRKEEIERARESQGELPEDADPILIFIARVGETSPKDVRERFALSRSTVFRRLDALVKSGALEKTGSTKASRYRLAA